VDRSASEDRREVRPIIKITSEIHDMVDAVQMALLRAAGDKLFDRAGVLVRIRAFDPDRVPKRNQKHLDRPVGVSSIMPVDLDWLIEQSSAVAQWRRCHRTTNEWVPAFPHRQAVRSLLARGQWPFSRLEGVLEHPFFRSDGTVVQEAGYDPVSGYICAPGRGFPCVPEQPTKAAFEEAVALVRKPFSEFSFVSASDWAAAACVPLSILARPAIRGPVPLFSITARTPGEGKTLLGKSLVESAGGRRPSMTAWPEERAEQEKLAFSACLEGLPVVMIDNVEGLFGSAYLSFLLTADIVTQRKFMTQTTIAAPHRTVWLATGNNLVYKGDTFRRVIPVHLDGRCERPEERVFKHDLPALLGRTGPRLASAWLTMLRYYHLAGRPIHGSSRMGSFESWDDLVRGAACFAFGSDPAAGRDRVRLEADPEMESMQALYEVWTESLGQEWFTLSSAVDQAADAGLLRTALAEVAVKDGKPDVRALGYRFRRWEGRILGGLRLDKNPKKTRNGIRWRVVRLAEGV
jgi:putative DNA primase/helicase